MSRAMHRHRAPRPVFVDASGRRQQGLRVAGLAGVLVAGGYVCVLVSTVLGGPTIQSALLPLPDAPSPKTVAAAQHPMPTGSSTSGPTQQSIVTVAPTTAMPTAAVAVTAGPTPTSVTTTALPTSVATATTKVTGKPTALPTQANKPTKPPR